jgi:hypothetical protein
VLLLFKRSAVPLPTLLTGTVRLTVLTALSMPTCKNRRRGPLSISSTQADAATGSSASVRVAVVSSWRSACAADIGAGRNQWNGATENSNSGVALGRTAAPGKAALQRGAAVADRKGALQGAEAV